MNKFLLALSVILALPAFAGERIVYPKIPSCPGVSTALEKFYEQRDLSAGLCYRLGEWEVLAVSSDAYSWLDFKRGSRVYSTERAVVYDVPNVKFPNLADGKMEVHINNDKLTGVVFRVVQGETNSGSSLYTVNLNEGGAYFCGREKANDKARAKLKAVDACTKLPEASIN